MNSPIFITGCAGFIGFHVSARLLEEGYDVIGLDGLNDYYDVSLKKARLEQLQQNNRFQFLHIQLQDRISVQEVFRKFSFHTVIHLAAQAGVRYSLDHPMACIDSNIIGFAHILESCRETGVQHLVFASSSSVYGLNHKTPFSANDKVDQPASLYAATKISNELMAHCYTHLYGIATTGLRFFTVYGPWGRPDMAYFKFTEAIMQGKPISIYNFGDMQRDFTYIDDVVEGLFRVIAGNGKRKLKGHKIYNIGNNRPIRLLEFVSILEKELGLEAYKQLLPMQPGDVPVTYADITDLRKDFNYQPNTPIETGLKKFVQWYKDYYKRPSKSEIE